MHSPKRTLFIALFLLVSISAGVRAQSDEVEEVESSAKTELEKQLASRDPMERQRAAEELAQVAAPSSRKLLEGYRLQEKNTRVKLALDWALYRIGKRESLFAVIRALDSSRFEQANGYLRSLESPEPLYLFLERTNGNTQIKLIDVLGKIGDATTLERMKPYSESYDLKIAEAAQLAVKEIEQRLGEPPPNTPTRPRQVGNP